MPPTGRSRPARRAPRPANAADKCVLRDLSPLPNQSRPLPSRLRSLPSDSTSVLLGLAPTSKPLYLGPKPLTDGPKPLTGTSKRLNLGTPPLYGRSRTTQPRSP